MDKIINTTRKKTSSADCGCSELNSAGVGCG